MKKEEVRKTRSERGEIENKLCRCSLTMDVFWGTVSDKRVTVTTRVAEGDDRHNHVHQGKSKGERKGGG